MVLVDLVLFCDRNLELLLPSCSLELDQAVLLALLLCVPIGQGRSARVGKACGREQRRPVGLVAGEGALALERAGRRMQERSSA